MYKESDIVANNKIELEGDVKYPDNMVVSWHGKSTMHSAKSCHRSREE